MIVEVDTHRAVPPYEQIKQQLSTMITAGVLAPGERLPTVRQLAADLGLAVNTVARAYRELELAGLVEARARRGTMVTPRPPAVSADELRRRLAAAAREYALVAAQLGATADEARRAVTDQWPLTGP